MADFQVQFPGIISKNDLRNHFEAVWPVKERQGQFDERYALHDHRYGGSHFWRFHELEDARVDLMVARSKLRVLKRRSKENFEKVYKTSCGNYVVYLLPEEEQKRRYYAFPWIELIFPIMDTVNLEKKMFQVMTCFASDESVSLAVTDAVTGNGNENNVVIYEFQHLFTNYASKNEVIDMGFDHRVTPSIIRQAQRKVSMQRKERDDFLMDLICYESEMVLERITAQEARAIHQMEANEAILLAAHFLKEGGSLILQTFSLEHSNWIPILYVLSSMFRSVCIKKPLASVRHSSEVFVECLGFIQDHGKLIRKKMDVYVESRQAERDAENGIPMIQSNRLPYAFTSVAVKAITAFVLWRTRCIRRVIGVLGVPALWDPIFLEVDLWKVAVANWWYSRTRLHGRLGVQLRLARDLPLIKKRSSLVEAGILTDLTPIFKIDRFNRPVPDLSPEEQDSVLIPDQVEVEDDDDGENQPIPIAVIAAQEYRIHHVGFVELNFGLPLHFAGHLGIRSHASPLTVNSVMSWVVGLPNEEVEWVLATPPTGRVEIYGSKTDVSLQVLRQIQQLLPDIPLSASLFITGLDYDAYAWSAIMYILHHLFDEVEIIYDGRTDHLDGVLFRNRNKPQDAARTVPILDAFANFEILLLDARNNPGNVTFDIYDPYNFIDLKTHHDILVPLLQADRKAEEELQEMWGGEMTVEERKTVQFLFTN